MEFGLDNFFHACCHWNEKQLLIIETEILTQALLLSNKYDKKDIGLKGGSNSDLLEVDIGQKLCISETKLKLKKELEITRTSIIYACYVYVCYFLCHFPL